MLSQRHSKRNEKNAHMEVGCTKSVKNICIVGVHQKELFLQGHTKTSSHLSHAFRQHERSERHMS